MDSSDIEKTAIDSPNTEDEEDADTFSVYSFTSEELGFEQSPYSARKPSLQYERTGIFPLFKLPTELRFMVYQFFLPHKQTLWFQYEGKKTSDDGRVEPVWKIKSISTDHLDMIRKLWAGTNLETYAIKANSSTGLSGCPSSLFRVNKQVYSEARSVLYKSNTYSFAVDQQNTYPNDSLLIFGPLGSPRHLHLLRDLRRIELTANISTCRSSKMTQYRERLAHFVNMIAPTGDDEAPKAALRELNVHLTQTHTGIPLPRSIEWTSERCMFALEGLANLRDIEKVYIHGVSDWFAACVQLWIQGKGGEVHEKFWPMQETGPPWRPIIGSTRHWYQPTLDWREFAHRNGIELPLDFWMKFYFIH